MPGSKGTKPFRASTPPEQAGRVISPGFIYAMAVLAATVAGLALRLDRIDHPMRYDESFTVLRYSLAPDFRQVLGYETPNNHILHTLAVKGSIDILGLSALAVRLPALLAGVACIPAAAMLARMLTRRRLPSVLAASAVAASSLMIEYSVNARGYSMVALTTLLLSACTLKFLRDPRVAWVQAAWSVLAALGAITIPVMVLPVAILSVIVVLQAFRGTDAVVVRRLILIRWALMLAGAGILTAALYIPVVYFNSLSAVTANRFVSPVGFSEMIQGLRGAIPATLEDWTRDMPFAYVLAMAAGLVACVGVGVRRRKAFWLLPAVAPAVLLLASLAQRVVPFPRVWLFLLPVMLTMGVCGLDEIAVRPLAGKIPWLARAIVATCVFALAGLAVVNERHRDFLISEDPRTLVDARAIIRDICDAGMCDSRTAVVSEVPAWPSLMFYSLLSGCQAEDLDFLHCNRPGLLRAFIVVGDRQTLEGVMQANPGIETYSSPILWREYPHASIYITGRK
jgi:hypothetical protein